MKIYLAEIQTCLLKPEKKKDCIIIYYKHPTTSF